MKNNYLIEYVSNFSYKKKIDELIKENGFENNYQSEYDLSENSLDSVLEDLDTYSFLSEKKVILLKNVELLDIDSKKTKHLFNYLENFDPNKLLIMSSVSLDSRKKITKELKNKVNYLKLESNSSLVIKDALKGYTIEEGVESLLIDYINHDIDAIQVECDKLKQYKYNEKVITKEDIKNICYKRIGDSTQLIFDLVKCICSKNKRDALIIYKRLDKYYIDDISLTGLLESQLRLLEQVFLLMDQKKKKQEIASILGIHPYRIEKTQELLRDVSKKEVEILIKRLGELDFKFKSGIYDINKPLEMFILNL